MKGSEEQRKRWREANARYRKTEKGRLTSIRNQTAAKIRDPHKRRARNLIYKRIRDGTMVRPNVCSLIDGSCDGDIHGHHDDYSKPAEVRWVCRKHHGDIHNGE